jgi:glycerol-3-phosphate O-acyltransferase
MRDELGSSYSSWYRDEERRQRRARRTRLAKTLAKAVALTILSAAAVLAIAVLSGDIR